MLPLWASSLLQIQFRLKNLLCLRRFKTGRPWWGSRASTSTSAAALWNKIKVGSSTNASPLQVKLFAQLLTNVMWRSRCVGGFQCLIFHAFLLFHSVGSDFYQRLSSTLYRCSSSCCSGLHGSCVWSGQERMTTQSDPHVPPTCGAAPRAPRAGASRTLRTPPSILCTHRTWLRSKQGPSTRGTLTSTPSPALTTTGTFFTWASRAWRTLQCSRSLSRGTTSQQGLHE